MLRNATCMLSVAPEVRLKLGEVSTVPLEPPIALVEIVPEVEFAIPVSINANCKPPPDGGARPVTEEETNPRFAPTPWSAQPDGREEVPVSNV